MGVKVGIPRGMLYYELYPMWKAYFNSLSIELVLSPKTNKDILNSGIIHCVDEACLPVKIFHGHVDYLKDKVDYIFIPKIISLYKKEFGCPKHLGLPDMVIHNIEDLPVIINPVIDLSKKDTFKRASNEIGKILGKGYKDVNRAYKDSMISQNNYREWLDSELIPNRLDKGPKDSILNLLVLGHPYNIYDEFINMDILTKLSNSDINMYFAEDISDDEVRQFSSKFNKRIFWTQGRRIVGSAYSLIEKGVIDGIIYLSAFGCGLDSVLVYLVEKKAMENNIPIMTISLDEQTGEAGFITRYEAFLDMMEWRLQDENYLSTFR